MITGYESPELLYQSGKSTVYRARRASDGRPVVLKSLSDPRPPPERIAWLEHEHEILRGIAAQPPVAGVIGVYDLVRDDDRHVLVLEDIGGRSLDQLGIAGRMDLSALLRLSIKLATVVGNIHRRHVIHKDINPSNIVLESESGELRLIDFGIATRLSRERASFRNPNILEGTLQYLSPEQTGRMNREIDSRSDLYSVGVTLYELATGERPFGGSDALELVHGHIARTPVPPHELRSDVPRALSDIILVLMAKNVEDRYQSAFGLVADLEACQAEFASNGRIELFDLRRDDVPDRFTVPQRLYGRERETSRLLGAFDRVGRGSVELTLVVGQAGIGKSALVGELHRPVTGHNGLFATGKFDQLERNIPYGQLAYAFRSLVQHVLAGDEAEVSAWREVLLGAMGANAGLMTEVIPELELIIGPQPSVNAESATEAQNRFRLVFSRFLKTFARPEHPLVIFLDDMQWADSASLGLLKLLLESTTGLSHLLVIGAYRDNEVDGAHPLALTLERIRKAGAAVEEMTLAPLTPPDIVDLVRDALLCSVETARPLAELLLRKTGGNPFFIRQFLKALDAENLLHLVPSGSDSHRAQWTYDPDEVAARNITDNVVDLMAGKVKELPEFTQDALRAAACVGNSFHLDMLALAQGATPKDAAESLWPAMVEGLIVPLTSAYKLLAPRSEGSDRAEALEALDADVTYKFAHDRVQQAVYSLIPAEQKSAVHFRIGQRLRANSEARKGLLFDIVYHLDRGRALVTDPDDRIALAELNLEASRRATAANAYTPALNYAEVGIELLDAGSWEDRYEATLGLHTQAAEAAFLAGDFEAMDRYADTVLENAGDLLDKVKIYEVRFQAHKARNQLMKAARTGFEVLRLLGTEFPEQPAEADSAAALQDIHDALAGREIDSLVDLPTMSDPVARASIRITNGLADIVFISHNQIYPFLFWRQVAASLRLGNAPESAFAYVNHGFILVTMGQVDDGYRFGQLALRLVKKFDARRLQAKVSLLYSFISHLREHLEVTAASYRAGYESAIECGDVEYAANHACVPMIDYYVGRELEFVDAEMAKYCRAQKRLKQEIAHRWNLIHWQAVLNFMGRSEDPTVVVGDVYDERKMRPVHVEAGDNSSLLHLYTQKVIVAYRFGAFGEAYAHAVELEKYTANAAGTYFAPVVKFYDSMARLGVLTDDRERGDSGAEGSYDRDEILARVAANLEDLARWAEHAPMNYAHKRALVAAELARVQGKVDEAHELYDQAIELAHEHGYINEEALAYELAGRSYLAVGRLRQARYYLSDAHYAHCRWGAHGKVADLERRYPRLIVRSSPTADVGTTSLRGTTQRGAMGVLDLASVFKASQAISGELVLTTLLRRMMTTIIENAGAGRGVLILDREGQWVIEADASIEGDTSLPGIPLSEADTVPLRTINFVARTREIIVSGRSASSEILAADPYIEQHQPESVLCAPLLARGHLSGILYLENQQTADAFTTERLAILKLLSSQAAISLENATLYRTLDQRVKDRTRELQQANEDLADTLNKLKAAQQQLIVQEKLASLGALTAGIAHELRNPLNFINNFADLSGQLVDDLKEVLTAPGTSMEPDDKEEVDDILGDLSENTSKIVEYGKRADGIIQGMGAHASATSAAREDVDLNKLIAECLDSTCHQMRARYPDFDVGIETKYSDEVGLVWLNRKDIDRVLANLLTNAYYALHQEREQRSAAYSPELQIVTRGRSGSVEVRVRDNGAGIAPDVLREIWTPFFTTKPPNEGTGLGLSISHDIVVQGHQGQLTAETSHGEFSEFIMTLPRRKSV